MGRFPALIPFTVSKTTPQADSATLYLVVRLRKTSGLWLKPKSPGGYCGSDAAHSAQWSTR